MEKYRFKTEVEFELAFGSSWRGDVQGGWNSQMEEYYGTAVSDEEFSLLANGYRYFEREDWCISMDMLIVDKTYSNGVRVQVNGLLG